MVSQPTTSSPAQEDIKRSHPLVKMCGITSAKDAAMAAEAGASLIDMIIWPKSKRSLFRWLKKSQKLQESMVRNPLGCLWMMAQTQYEELLMPQILSLCSGKGFNWEKFKLPSIKSKHGWLLAGGINCENVREAIATLRSHGVDVSSGIYASDGVQKDPFKISSFMNMLNSVSIIDYRQND
ncbi:N-(5'-phosphoribosyl)anthranilate isomerase 1, chloroplastic-like [Magnolia sinica]|uniref:N-(5'-phosphoribosyl)anthranilate isomerase 1, chloroplastic-like n=1 Tax=Magnolia sinica TaxID=86752 RepID=UPI0026595D9D|nr:N-(5'-phosphoribosyl)anthranilate isomerase 1, chloroplastic-like [Magnolia sinica]